MRLSLVKSKNTTQFYIIQSYRDENGKNTSKIIEKLGNEQEVIKKANGKDPIVWAKEYIEKKNKEAKENKVIYYEKLVEGIELDNKQKIFNIGYIFLKDIYYKLGLNNICKEISNKYRIKYDLNSILSNLIYTRIIEPSSKLSSFETSKKFIEQPNYELHDIYRALEIISKETDCIEAEVYKNSLNVVDRNTEILYYDCTNYFFEIEQAEGLKQYGLSKENRPNPIVQMGLFMDGNGYPLAFNINSGNTNEQTTLKPLEKQIMKDFEVSKFIVCTDAGLASTDNRKFNTVQERSYIVTQSLKRIKDHLKEWALSPENWHTLKSNKQINLNEIDEDKNYEEIYYKERWINENGLEQRLIVSYSPKYATYQKSIRNKQIERAQNLINSPSKLSKKRQDDPKRFITASSITTDGEIASKRILSLNTSAIENEAQFDGFYAVCTTLEDDISEIIKINKRRWEIEESFRILKTDFKARPVYLKRDDRIKAHFTTCFLSLLIYRILENKLENRYSTRKIISTLQEMNSLKITGCGYKQIYENTDITRDLSESFNIDINQDFISLKNMKKILKNIK